MSEFLRPLEERYFEDYVQGIDIRCGHETVSEEEILRFAQAFDPQWIHTDPDAAKTGPFAGLIASGWHTSAIVMRVVVTHYLNENASLASPGVDELRWVKPVRAGDVLSARFTVIEARPSQTKADRGIVRTRITVLNQLDEAVMTMVAMNIIRRRPAAD